MVQHHSIKSSVHRSGNSIQEVCILFETNMTRLPLLVPFFIFPFYSCTVYKNLFETLISRYNRIAFPSGTHNNSLTIEFKLRLDQIVDVHEKDQVITLKGTLIHHWLDVRLSWNPEEFGNITLMHFPGEMLWLPDIILYNNAHGSPWVSETTQVHVSHEGRVTWQPPVVYDAFCNIDIEWYPYDQQICELKFGSWTYGGSQLNLIHLDIDKANESTDATGDNVWKVERGVDLSNYQESVEWDLLSVEGIRHKKWYPCCDYPSIDITYYLHIRRKKLFYTINMIIPCVSLASLTLWVFYLPCESHQKVQLCISVLVALTIYFLMLIDIIPPTSIATPLILKYLSFTMVMVALSVTFTVLVQNIHYREHYQEMPRFVKKWFIEKLGKQLLINRKTEKAQYHRTAQHVKIATMAKKKNAPSTSVSVKTVNSLLLELPMLNRSVSVKIRKPSVKAVKNRVRRLLSIDTTDDARIKEPEDISPETVKDSDPDREKLRKAERNVHFIAKTLTDERKAQEAEADWQFVSLVIDRLLLVIFTITITTGTVLTIFSAPTMLDNREPIEIN